MPAPDPSATAKTLQQARHEALAAHSRHVAHSLGNMLTGLSLTLELLAATQLDATQARYVTRCLHLAGRLGQEKDLLAGLGGGSMQPKAWHATLPLLEAALARYCVGEDLVGEVAVEAGAEQVYADAGLLHQALCMLVRNACDALVTGGRLGILARPALAQRAGAVELVVWDEGAGPLAALKADFGRAPVSSKPHGNGMGLLLVSAIVEGLHGGTFVLEPRQPLGAEARATLPSAPPDA